MTGLSLVQTASAWRLRSANTLAVYFIALWLLITVVWLGTLLSRGNRYQQGAIHTHIICGLACFWILFVVAIVAEDSSVCSPSKLSCGLLTVLRILSWLPIVTGEFCNLDAVADHDPQCSLLYMQPTEELLF
ncbi:hypothetical protein FB45DRAFT_921889 [Roridomyces roridus]|uniref:Uncharacterized protein n=1 Tax=Roridomyces roridus TaxID=1738132 RepID=A0AAD7FI35_9AGAR|nr:hypothetical protein FB45DRAFT_921889 [Roridomyces roridus]